MFTKFIIIVLFTIIIIIRKACGLNESEYLRMPPIFHLDPYEACLHQPEGIYCSVQLHLVTDKPNPLYTMIQNYSAPTTHFNHTYLQYGICLTKTCKKLYEQNKGVDQIDILERCLNESLWKDYKLKVRVVPNKLTCEKFDINIEFDTSYVVVAVVFGIIVIANIVGSLAEFCRSGKNVSKQGNGLLDCFSIYQNLRRLVASTQANPDPRIKRLKGLYGLRAISTTLIVACHSLMPFLLDSDNTRYIEESQYQAHHVMVANGALIVQTFFIISGFFLAYHVSVYEETHHVSWRLLPKSILIRWLRLSAPYAVILAFTATWLQKVGSGPLWQLVIVQESNDCGRDWWYHLLYFNNYVDHSYCMPQSWYVASDFQLHVVGSLVLLLLQGRSRKIVLSFLFAAAIIMPALHTYFQDLEAVFKLSPESARKFFISDHTFNHTHKRGHTNLASFIIGVTLGLVIYRWQRTDHQFNKYTKHRYLYWSTFPAMLGVIYIGYVFYEEVSDPSAVLRALFAGIIKPIFSTVIAWIVVGMIFKFEDVYRSILEWQGWGAWSRVSYCAYLVHVMVVRYLTALHTTLVHATVPSFGEGMASTVVLSYACALPLYLFVEVPAQRLVKLMTETIPKTTADEKEQVNSDEVVKHCEEVIFK